MGGPRDYTVLIDGYNVIKRHAAWNHAPLPEARHRLMALLTRTRWSVAVSRILVVFDGPVSESVSSRGNRQLEVHFATPSADAYIQRAIRTSPTPEHLLIISDDGEILRTAKSHGTRRYSTHWLFERSLSATPPPHPDRGSEKIALSASTARRITEELAKRWLGICKH